MKKFLTLFAICLTACTLNAQWQPQAVNTLPVGYNVLGLSVVNDKVVWAVSHKTFSNSIPKDHVSKVLRSTDAGQTWQVHDIEEATGRVSWDIQAFDSLTAWIISQDYNNGSGRGLFKTTDGGGYLGQKIHRYCRWCVAAFFQCPTRHSHQSG